MADKLYIKSKGRNKKSKLSNLSNVKKILIVLGILGFSLIMGAGIAISSISSFLPDVNQIKHYTPNQTSQIYDSNNKLLGKIYDEENRVVTPLKDIPKYVQQAVISMEDERFYKHGGVDTKAVIRSFFSVLPGVHLVRGGGSTLTQQLARNLFLTRDIKISRKIAEIFMARKIEQVLSKDEILQLYLNEVYWGHNAYGVEAASRVFFGKSVKNLNLAEASMIGGLLSSPEYYSPYKSLERAKWRQSLTLQNMVKNGYITKDDAEKAKNTKIYLIGLKRSFKISYPYFTSYVVALLRSKYDDNTLKTGGLKIYTTVDSDAQALAEKVISEGVARLSRQNITQGALVSVDPNNGYIRAIVGGVSYEDSEFNRITQAKRQPGSSFKPIVYLTAFKKQIVNPYSQMIDEPLHYPNWSPKNFDGTFRGKMTVMQAIQHSINTVAIKTLELVGTQSAIEMAGKLGITSKLNDNLSLALGSSEVTPLEMAKVYSVFATGGKRVKEFTPILKIVDKDGKVLEDNTQYVSTENVIDPASVGMLNDCLKAVVTGGSGTAAQLYGREVAGKTGTTSDSRDSWFIGFTPQLVTLVWVGNDNNSRMIGATGGGICAPIWKKYMQTVIQKYPVKKFPETNWQNSVKSVVTVQSVQPVPSDQGNKIEEITPTPTPQISASDDGVTFTEENKGKTEQYDDPYTKEKETPLPDEEKKDDSKDESNQGFNGENKNDGQ